ncbi:MAG TPA: hypothetical protein ENI23_10160 [bacterium]|nr:hypothetical protein [bacterium]
MSDKTETQQAIKDVQSEVNKIRRMKIQMKKYFETHPQNNDAEAMISGMEIQYKQLLKADMILRAHLSELK